MSTSRLSSFHGTGAPARSDLPQPCYEGPAMFWIHPRWVYPRQPYLTQVLTCHTQVLICSSEWPTHIKFCHILAKFWPILIPNQLLTYSRQVFSTLAKLWPTSPFSLAKFWPTSSFSLAKFWPTSSFSLAKFWPPALAKFQPAQGLLWSTLTYLYPCPR